MSNGTPSENGTACEQGLEPNNRVTKEGDTKDSVPASMSYQLHPKDYDGEEAVNHDYQESADGTFHSSGVGGGCNESSLQKKIASRSQKSGTVTSFIVSEEPRDEITYIRQTPPADANIVEPREGSELREGDAYMCCLDSSMLTSPKMGEATDVRSETPILLPSVPSPTLVGHIAAGVVSGVWGMTREAAMSGDSTQTSKFEYKYKSGKFDVPSGLTAPQSGGYSGYFYLQVPGKTTPVKVIENSINLEFAPNSAGLLNIRGQGKNRYGPFTISGTCRADGSALELARTYIPKPLAVPKPRLLNSLPATCKSIGKDLSRVQAALSKPQSSGASAHSLAVISALTPQPASSSSGCNAFATSSFDGDNEGKRSGRARKAPSHLRDSVSSNSNPNTRVHLEDYQMTEALQRCHAIVTSLERLAGSDWFSAPVDAVALGVPHYSSIVDAPMDLGTVKRGLNCGLYSDPHAFAADMRLVFRNAMTFNVLPEAPVHEAARNLHVRFEDQLQNIWKHLAGSAPGSAKFKRDLDGDQDIPAQKRPRVTNGKGGTKKGGKGKKGPRDDEYGLLSAGGGMVPVADLVTMQRQMESMQATIAALQKQASQTEVQVQMNMELGLSSNNSGLAVSKTSRVSKPLTFGEKEALSNDINALPPEKLAHVVKIVQESMPLTSRHDDDEIEVDIETLDNDTLRHLQKYVKASLGKKRAAPKKKSTKVLFVDS